MREDVLAQRMFMAGCLGLPWLWVVNVMYFRSQDDNDNEEEEEGVRQERDKWVKRSMYGAFVVLSAWAAWIVVFLSQKDSFGPEWFIMSQEEGDKTGW
mmetsp:Transcript_13944/g.21179  ORF Transcript_13944/g.21179 Transcript_13944/m.21179 type:complete len:98 (-) Transcript_13944:78-371(-)|eukprot:CAMPEP_0118701024 /NCGR_PEP_ID=MMETSP0800-20121206/16977_1 /TAXON_ID=210618 ORGANISM="Striatella unipunctata, Strain CCMP2910" /NCGR_SAMPLE_ID=MMETSP0800 /ASSEMBLY_ACC=CAM_ASM_000638 /LENGTH=97 /DNA_ID=CAMNT_0006601811 /DNA_START=56 /DNA_END=349 /DNA_ORIENTATION=-